MRFIARLAMRGPYHAAGVAAVALLGSGAIGLLIIIAGAVVALATLRHGSREGLRVMLLAGVVATAARLLTGNDALPVLVLGLVVWLPSWLLAANLRRSRRQALPLTMIGVLVVCYAAAIRAAVGDVTAFWVSHLTPLFELLARQGGARLSEAQIGLVAAQIHIWSLVAIFAILASMLLLARWWQAALFNPGGFGSEFRELRLPPAALVVAALAAVLLVADRAAGLGLALAGDVFVVVVVLFAFQGLALIHHRARRVSLSGGWLAGLYVMLLLLPQVVGPLLATVGVADGMADFRRLGARSGADE